MEMIEQKRYIDDNEGTGINEFLDDIIEKYKLRELNSTQKSIISLTKMHWRSAKSSKNE